MARETFEEFRARREAERAESWNLRWRSVGRESGGGYCAPGPNGETFRIKRDLIRPIYRVGRRVGREDVWEAETSSLPEAKRRAAEIASRALGREVS